MFPYPILISDIGGTNARFAFTETAASPLVNLVNAGASQFPGFIEVCNAVIAQSLIKPASLIVCAAGPVNGRSAGLTNINWRIDGPETAKALGLEQGLLLNDFEALALSLPALHDEDVMPIGACDRAASPDQLKLILGPGTGLGAAALATANGKYLPLASEIGHIDFAPLNDEEHTLFKYFERPLGRLSAESLLCGRGLVRLHQARQNLNGAKRYVAHRDPAEILGSALQDHAGEEADTIRYFWRLIARFAGDAALTFAAHGGVTLAGGVLPKLLPFLDQAQFRHAFEDKPPMRQLMTLIPTHLLIRENAVLEGLRTLAQTPHHYCIDYKQRCWL